MRKICRLLVLAAAIVLILRLGSRRQKATQNFANRRQRL